MKYQYQFATENITIDIDEEWVCVLREFDRMERNSNIKSQKSSIHYDAFAFVPDFLGLHEKGYLPKDETVAEIFDGSPAFEYALAHLTPRHCDVLFRRAILEESFPSIAKSYKTDTSTIHSYYQRLCARIKKHYIDWKWLHSCENEVLPRAGNVTVVTPGLTYDQILAIRKNRYQCKTIREIAQVVGVSITLVINCLRDNPILETICPSCGKPIEQGAFGAMKVFCSRKCYFYWFRRNSQNPEADLHTINGKTYLSDLDKLAIDFYRQLYIPVPRIGALVGVSRQHVSAHAYSNPLPYTICWHCGTPIPGEPGGKPRKFCSDECYWRYYNREKKDRQQTSYKSPNIIIPSSEQIKYAAALFKSGYSFSLISSLSGLTEDNMERLFRFSYLMERICPYCGNTFMSTNVEMRYCSEKCQTSSEKSYDKYFKKEKQLENVIMDRRFPTKVVTGIVTIINAHIWEPYNLKNTCPVYTVTLLIPKEDTKTLNGINIAIDNAIKLGASQHRGRYAQAAKRNIPLHDGDAEHMNPRFHGHMILNAASITQPAVFDTQLYPASDRDFLYSGCCARVSLTFFPIRNEQYSGIGCALGNFQRINARENPTLLHDIDFDLFVGEYMRIFDR